MDLISFSCLKSGKFSKVPKQSRLPCAPPIDVILKILVLTRNWKIINNKTMQKEFVFYFSIILYTLNYLLIHGFMYTCKYVCVHITCVFVCAVVMWAPSLYEDLCVPNVHTSKPSVLCVSSLCLLYYQQSYRVHFFVPLKGFPPNPVRFSVLPPVCFFLPRHPQPSTQSCFDSLVCVCLYVCMRLYVCMCLYVCVFVCVNEQLCMRVCVFNLCVREGRNMQIKNNFLSLNTNQNFMEMLQIVKM